MNVVIPQQLERAVKESLEKMLGLALGFALLRAQPLESSDDLGEFLLERKRRYNYRQSRKFGCGQLRLR